MCCNQMVVECYSQKFEFSIWYVLACGFLAHLLACFFCWKKKWFLIKFIKRQRHSCSSAVSAHIFSQWHADLSFIHLFVIVIIVPKERMYVCICERRIERDRVGTGWLQCVPEHWTSMKEKKNEKLSENRTSNFTWPKSGVLCCLMYDTLVWWWLVNIGFYLIPLSTVHCTSAYGRNGKKEGGGGEKRSLTSTSITHFWISFWCFFSVFLKI